MNKHYGSRLLLGLCVTFALGGCIDNDYDLKDIDTTAQLRVNDLTLPLNLDPITLDGVISLNENDCVTTNEDGNYVIIKTGTFHSDDIEVKAITAKLKTEFDPVKMSIPALSTEAVTIHPTTFDFDYSYNQVEKYIQGITSGTVDFPVTMIMILKDQKQKGEPCRFSDLTFKLPDGMYGEIEQSTTPVKRREGQTVTFEDGETNDGVFKFVYHVTSFNAAQAHATLNPGNDERKGIFEMQNAIALTSGKVAILTADPSKTLTLTLTYELGLLDVLTLDGKMFYKVDDMEVTDVYLNNMPDFLDQKGTRIALDNPMVYVSLNNPLYEYGVTGSAGINVTQVRDAGTWLDGSAHTASLAKPLKIGAVPSATFCLAEKEPKDYYSEYPGVKWDSDTRFMNLGHIIYGEGLPSSLSVEFVNPQMDESEVKNFPLGRKFDRVEGTYTFYAPLQFAAGSQIVYEDTQDGWGIDETDNLVIEHLSISMHVKSDLPLGIVLTAEPVDAEGNIITDGVKPIEIEGADIAAYGDQDVTIKINGKITNIDGIRYTAKAVSTGVNQTVNKNQGVNLTNIRAKVSGYYINVDKDHEK